MTKNRLRGFLSSFRSLDAQRPHLGGVRRFATAFRRFAKGSLLAVRQKICRHEFDLSDLRKTGIPDPVRPSDQSGYQAFVDWHHELLYGDSVMKRVVWPCSKCGKTFYAHCGLDISPKYGPIKLRSEKSTSTDNHQLITRLKLCFYAAALRFKRCSMPPSSRQSASDPLHLCTCFFQRTERTATGFNF